MKKEVFTLVGLLALSGCKEAHYPVEQNYVGVATSDSRCYTDISNDILPYSKLEFGLEIRNRDGEPRDVLVVYFRDRWANCTEFPKISTNDKVRITNGKELGIIVVVRFPEGMVRNLSQNSRY